MDGSRTALTRAILCAASGTFREPTARERSALAAAFAGRNFVVYGKAFDIVKLSGTVVLYLGERVIRVTWDQAVCHPSQTMDRLGAAATRTPP